MEPTYDQLKAERDALQSELERLKAINQEDKLTLNSIAKGPLKIVAENKALQSTNHKLREALEKLMAAWEDGGIRWITDATEEAKAALTTPDKPQDSER